jgi:1,4-alpha-glucan branching enzyme
MTFSRRALPVFPKIQNINKNAQRMKTPLFENKDLTIGNRMVQFAFPAPTARQVSLAGDFNSWDTKAGPMHKGPDGVWHLAVALKPGRYEYRFFADEVWCNDPAAQQMAKNSLGTENCVRMV